MYSLFEHEEVAGVVAIYSTTVKRDILQASRRYPECRKKYTNVHQSPIRFAVAYAKGKYAPKQG
jgi:hypothetical protein